MPQSGKSLPGRRRPRDCRRAVQIELHCSRQRCHCGFGARGLVEFDRIAAVIAASQVVERAAAPTPSPSGERSSTCSADSP
jgi:hypothetical protein